MRPKSAPQRLKHLNDLMAVFDEYGRPPEYYGEIVSLAKKWNVKDKALALEIECMAKYAGDGVSCNGIQSAESNTLSAQGLLDKALSTQ